MENESSEGLAEGLAEATSPNVKAQMVICECEEIVDPGGTYREARGEDALLHDSLFQVRILDEAYSLLAGLMDEDKITEVEANQIYAKIVKILESGE
jgi:hypothetical protein